MWTIKKLKERKEVLINPEKGKIIKPSKDLLKRELMIHPEGIAEKDQNPSYQKTVAFFNEKRHGIYHLSYFQNKGNYYQLVIQTTHHYNNSDKFSSSEYIHFYPGDKIYGLVRVAPIKNTFVYLKKDDSGVLSIKQEPHLVSKIKELSNVEFRFLLESSKLSEAQIELKELVNAGILPKGLKLEELKKEEPENIQDSNKEVIIGYYVSGEFDIKSHIPLNPVVMPKTAVDFFDNQLSDQSVPEGVKSYIKMNNLGSKSKLLMDIEISELME